MPAHRLAPRPAWLCAGLLLSLLGCASQPARLAPQEAVIGASTTAASLSVDPSRGVDRLIAEALALEDAGHFEQAIAKHEEALKIRPREVRSANTIAGLQGVLQHFDEELTWADRAIAIDASFAPAWVNRGNALGSLGRLEEADVAFGRAVQLDPTLAAAHNGRGVVADTREDFDTAVYHYREAVAAEPDFEVGWFNLGAALANLQRFDEAIAALRQVLQLDPDAKDAQTLLAQLNARVADAPPPVRR